MLAIPRPSRDPAHGLLSLSSSTLRHESWTCLPPGSCMRPAATSVATLSMHSVWSSADAVLFVFVRWLGCRGCVKDSRARPRPVMQQSKALRPNPRETWALGPMCAVCLRKRLASGGRHVQVERKEAYQHSKRDCLANPTRHIEGELILGGALASVEGSSHLGNRAPA